MKVFLASLVFAAVSVASATPIVPLVGDIAVMQQNADGTYDVICKNGNREKVTDHDIRLNNVCPNRTSSEPTNILSLQLRPDGNFDVVCKDLSRLVATPEDVVAGKACVPQTPPPPPPLVIEDGTYVVTSGYTGFCAQDVKANVESGKLASISISWCGGRPNAIPCSENVCTARIGAYDYTIKILNNKQYDFQENANRAVFSKQ